MVRGCLMTATLFLWSDDPARIDLLSFDAVAQTVADALPDEALDPVVLGLFGNWDAARGNSDKLGRCKS